MIEILLSLDGAVFYFINHLPHNAAFDGIAFFISGIGKAGIIWLILGALLFLQEKRKHHTFFVPIVTAGAVSWFLVDIILKPLIARPRPTQILTDYAFPSGHATIAFAMAVVLSRIEPKWRRWFFALAIAISFSRIYLGVHYPMDVIAGALLGWAIGTLSLRFLGIIKR